MNERTHEPYGRRRLTALDRWGVWLSQRAIRRRLPRRDGLTLLELGCGYHATQLAALRSRASRATAVDFALAEELRRDPIYECLEASIAEALPRLAGREFDAILMISVLEHLAEPEAILRSVAALLRPEGVLLLNVPTWRGKWFLEFSAFRLGWSPRIEMDDHKMYYDKRDLWPMLVQAGFRPSAIRLRYHKFGLNLFAVARR